jgi:hypothetical protein
VSSAVCTCDWLAPMCSSSGEAPAGPSLAFAAPRSAGISTVGVALNRRPPASLATLARRIAGSSPRRYQIAE